MSCGKMEDEGFAALNEGHDEHDGHGHEHIEDGHKVLAGVDKTGQVWHIHLREKGEVVGIGGSFEGDRLASVDIVYEQEEGFRLQVNGFKFETPESEGAFESDVYPEDGKTFEKKMGSRGDFFNFIKGEAAEGGFAYSLKDVEKFENYEQAFVELIGQDAPPAPLDDPLAAFRSAFGL